MEGNLVAAGKGSDVVEAGERHKPGLRNVADALLGARMERVQLTAVHHARLLDPGHVFVGERRAGLEAPPGR